MFGLNAASSGVRFPIAAIGGRTPLEAAEVPNMDFMAANGAAGMVQVVPKEMYPGSDVSNLSILGYDPVAVYTGRSPLEAASIGISLGPDDVAVRCNIVALKDEGSRIVAMSFCEPRSW